MKHSPVRLICLVLVLLLLVASVVPASAAKKKKKKQKPPSGAYVVEITNPRDRLNVHGIPDINDISDHLEDGTVVMYMESEDGWWYVEWWKGQDLYGEGYVAKDFLSKIDKDPDWVFKNVVGLYVHSQPRVPEGECEKYHIGLLKKGTKLKILEQDGTWCKIAYEDGFGWIPSRYLVRVKK